MTATEAAYVDEASRGLLRRKFWRRVLLTCDNDNYASQKTILSQRGKKENEVFLEDENCVVERYWIDL